MSEKKATKEQMTAMIIDLTMRLGRANKQLEANEKEPAELRNHPEVKRDRILDAVVQQSDSVVK